MEDRAACVLELCNSCATGHRQLGVPVDHPHRAPTSPTGRDYSRVLWCLHCSLIGYITTYKFKKHIHAFEKETTEFDFKNWLHTTTVVWELSLPGLSFRLGNALAYIILHLQMFAASPVQTVTCREKNGPGRGAGWMDGWGPGKGSASRVGMVSLFFLPFQQEGSLSPSRSGQLQAPTQNGPCGT